MVNSWIAHVKRYASENNVPYKVAMKQAKASYNKMSGGMTLKEWDLGEWDKRSQKKKRCINKRCTRPQNTSRFWYV